MPDGIVIAGLRILKFCNGSVLGWSENHIDGHSGNHARFASVGERWHDTL